MNGDDRDICAFGVDARTEQVLREALDGYKKGNVHRGDMAAAIKHLIGVSSPQVVIVDLDGSKFPAGSIHELAGVCEVGTSVIAVGSNDTARLARELLAAGVDDYFPKPLSAGEIREALRATLDVEGAPPRLHAGRVIAFAGAGGGCGVTTLAVVTAQASATRGSYVAAVDLARTSGALSWMLDAEPPAGLEELLGLAASGNSTGPDMLDGMCASAGPRLSVYGYRAGDGVPPAPTPAAVRWLTEQLANRSHLVIVDGMADPETLFPVLEDADERVLVYEPTLVSLNHVTHILALLGEGREVVLAENHTRARKSALSPRQIRQALAGRAPDLTIPFEPKLPAATNRGKPGESLGKKFRWALDRLVDNLTRPTVSLAGAGAAADSRAPR